MPEVEYYRQKYALGVADKSNSLRDYNRFLANSGESHSLEEFISHQLLHAKTVRVLDVGCGNAGALKELKKEFGEKIFVIGMDLIDFDLATNKVDEKLIGNAQELVIPPNLDLVISFRALHEIGELETVLTRIAQSLSPLGIALLSVRLHDVTSKKSSFSGSITKKDEEFLVKIGGKNYWMDCKVKAKMASIASPVDPKQTIITGIFVKLVKKED
ncbi:MAG: methyltransferase domain-containing protein [Candidatus Micrarchaeota archaeon]